MGIQITNTLDGLAADMRTMPRQAAVGFSKAVRSNVNEGKRRARRNAKITARRHGRLYPDAITAEMRTALSGEFGPETYKSQGGMSFERGSKNQPPHRDLERAASGLKLRLARDADDVVGRLFW